MAGLVRPRAYPIRKVTDNSQSNGKIYNPRRFPDHGGFTGASSWPEQSIFPVTAPSRSRETRTAEESDRSLSE